MWNYLKSYLKTFDLLKKGYWIFWTLVLFVMSMAALPASSLFLFPTGAVFANVVKLFGDDAVVPYWGRKFSKRSIHRLLAGETFKPYVGSDGKTVRHVKVSSSGRWVSVKERYYPLPLVKNFTFKDNGTKCSVHMIDGAATDEQPWTGDENIEKALTDIIGFVNEYDDELCKSAFNSAKDKMKLDYSSLSTADWNEFRYLWEQKCREESFGKNTAIIGEKSVRRLTDPSSKVGTIYTRSLTDNEIASIVQKIKEGKFKNANRFANISKYQKDIYVLNGVKLFDMLGYPDNIKAENFLFECIKDLEKPYFDDAIKVLAKFPREHLVASIERHVEKAHEEGDYVFGAGLLALSRAIDYEISLEKEDGVAAPVNATVSSDAGKEITGFTTGSDSGQGAAVAFKIE